MPEFLPLAPPESLESSARSAVAPMPSETEPTPLTLAHMTACMQQMITLEDIAGTSGWCLNDEKMLQPPLEYLLAIRDSQYSAPVLGECIGAMYNLVVEAERQHAAEADHQPALKFESLLNQLSRVAPSDLLWKAYFSEMSSPEASQPLHSMMAAADTKDELAAAVQMLLKVYDLGIDQLHDLPLADPLARKLLESEKLPEAKVRIALDTMLAAVGGLAEHRAAGYEVAKAYLRLSGLTKDHAQKLVDLSRDRSTDPRTGKLKEGPLSSMLYANAGAYHKLSQEKMARVWEKAGILDLEYFAPHQLELMSGFLDKDPEILAHLRAGDVTVAFVDEGYDYNGAMKTVSENFDTATQHALFFGFNQLSSFYRAWALLKERNVRPSTLVAASHGVYGCFSDGHLSIFGVKPPHEIRDAAFLPLAAGLKRFVAEGMQDSRGRIEPASTLGRRRIILVSCAQATEKEEEIEVVFDQQPWGTQKVESIGRVLLRQAENTSLDVYAGKGKFYLRRDAGNLLLGGVKEDSHGHSLEAGPIPFTRYRYNSQGNILSDELAELALYRDSAHLL